MRQTWLASILSAILLHYANEDKIDYRGSDLENELSVLGRNAAFRWAIDRDLGLQLGGQLPSRTRHSSLGSTKYHVRGLSQCKIVASCGIISCSEGSLCHGAF